MHRILLGVPSGGSIHDGPGSSAEASFCASLRHQVFRQPSAESGPNFNRLWQRAINGALAGQITHFAMIHADLRLKPSPDPSLRWLDEMIEELDKADADFISTPMAIKDPRGLTSCGIGDPSDRWTPFRRLCTNEIDALPLTFDAADLRAGDKFLLHNHALCVWDMRKPVWFQPRPDGRVPVMFNFEERLAFEISASGERVVNHYIEPEDWYFSREMWLAGARTCITSRVKVDHAGSMFWPNNGNWGTYRNGDENTQAKWRGEPGWRMPDSSLLPPTGMMQLAGKREE